MPTTRRPKLDLNQLAKGIVDQAVGDAPKVDVARKLAGRKGGIVGGKKRMEAMTADEKARLSALGVAGRKTPASSRAGVRKVVKGNP